MLKWFSGMGGWFIRHNKIPLSLILLALAIYFPAQGMAQSVNVPPNHWIYDILERWETQGYIENIYGHTKPYSRQEVAEYLSFIFQSYARNPQKFSPFDEQYLQYCATEFAEELQEIAAPLPEGNSTNRFRELKKIKPLSSLWPDILYQNNRNLLKEHYKEFHIYSDPIFQASSGKFLSASDTLSRLTRTSNGFLFRGNLGRVGFYFMLTDNKLKRNPQFPDVQVLEESGWPFLLQKNYGRVDFDENIAYLTLTHKYFTLLLGRDYNQWGAGHQGNLLLSTNAPVYDQIKLTVRYWRFKYTHITAFLQYISPEARLRILTSDPVDTYWAGNRVEVYLGKGIQLGMAQSVVYGNRSLQPGYMNPLAFFASLEHFYGDRDNNQMSFDLAWRIRDGLKIFGEFFIDDITFSKLGSDYFGNKTAYQAGLFWVNPLHLEGSDILVEYTRIRPYIYSHSIQDYNKYKHYDTILGHYIGPNSDDFYLRLRKYFSRRLRLQFTYEHYRHGQNAPDSNAGGDPDLPFRVEDNRNAPFLGGERIFRTVLTAGIRYEILRNLFFTMRWQRLRSENVSWRTAFFVRIGFNFGYRPEPFRPFQPAFK